MTEWSWLDTVAGTIFGWSRVAAKGPVYLGQGFLCDPNRSFAAWGRMDEGREQLPQMVGRLDFGFS